ncbi:MAG: radical SAM protein [Deltaproteobacteria bacterium]|nr:radical SAM protein [Deltaproteobacteria bacterium]
MKPLWLRGVSGLYQEFYQPDTDALVSATNIIDNNLLDSGRIFWSSLLQPERIMNVVSALEENIHNPTHQIPQFLGVMADKSKFISDILDYRTSICDQGEGPRQFFCKLETLAILCEMYSRFEFYPFRLTVQNAFLLDEVSAREIVDNCQCVSHNPYLVFIKSVILPLVLDYSPEVIFCIGRISYFHIALAIMVKNKLSDVHISFTRHSSEYFSLNKIAKYLKNNAKLFSVIDSIVLEHFDEIEQALLEGLEADVDLSNMPYILLFKKEPQLLKNATREAYPSVVTGRNPQVPGLVLSPDKFYDIHFEPQVKCYWNKCIFCGINKKYTYDDYLQTKEQIEQKINNMCSRVPKKSFLWFIDEAIHPSKLRLIAEHLVLNNYNFVWQARSRINSDLLANGLPEKLAQSGLKELRLGLESGSLKILRLMKKFEEGFTLNIVNQIVRTYYDYGVSIHFPMIIGFPGEDLADRQKTYELLSNLREKYSTFTFNINIFNFDICSPLFKTWDNYAISAISFPCSPYDYIGNIITWDDPTKTDESILNHERNAFMREKLYNWMPPNSFIAPTTFYRLSETIRNTLPWKNDVSAFEDSDLPSDKSIQLSPGIVICKRINGECLAYNWSTHHYIEGDETMLHILNEWRTPKQINRGIQNLCHNTNANIDGEDLLVLIRKLLWHGHFIIIENSNNVN